MLAGLNILAVRAIEDHIAALGAEGHLDRISENIEARKHLVAGGFVEAYVFGRHVA
jgi:hypothetical protein